MAGGGIRIERLGQGFGARVGEAPDISATQHLPCSRGRSICAMDTKDHAAHLAGQGGFRRKAKYPRAGQFRDPGHQTQSTPQTVGPGGVSGNGAVGQYSGQLDGRKDDANTRSFFLSHW
jgi:hypothetical protein